MRDRKRICCSRSAYTKEKRKLLENIKHFKGFLNVTKSDYGFVMSVRSHGTTSVPTGRKFNKRLYLGSFRKSVEKIEVWLKFDKNNEYFTWRPMYIYDNILLNFCGKDKCFKRKLYRKSRHILCSKTVSEDRAVYEIMWEKHRVHYVFLSANTAAK